jgi:hypothetical protein
MQLISIAQARGNQHFFSNWVPVQKPRPAELAVSTHILGKRPRYVRYAFDNQIVARNDFVGVIFKRGHGEPASQEKFADGIHYPLLQLFRFDDFTKCHCPLAPNFFDCRYKSIQITEVRQNMFYAARLLGNPLVGRVTITTSIGI